MNDHVYLMLWVCVCECLEQKQKNRNLWKFVQKGSKENAILTLWEETMRWTQAHTHNTLSSHTNAYTNSLKNNSQDTEL